MIKKFKGQSNIIIELFQYVIEKRKFWLAPLIFILLLLGSLLFIVEGSVIAPFIYTIF